MGKMQGKVAIVTGSGRGIGRGIAMRFGAEGAKVVVASRSKSTVDKVVDEIKRAGGTALGLPCDVGHQDELKTMVAKTIETFGAIDVLVNNAQGHGTETSPGGSPVEQPLESYDLADWDYTFRTGATASLVAMQLVFPHMKNRGGRIINFGSEYGVVGWPKTVAYNATKEAIRALTRTAAREWGPYKITVNCINPVVMTDGVVSVFHGDTKAAAAVAEQRIPVGRWGDAFKDAGGLCVFLASDDASYLNGVTFNLDGGMCARP